MGKYYASRLITGFHVATNLTLLDVLGIPGEIQPIQPPYEFQIRPPTCPFTSNRPLPLKRPSEKPHIKRIGLSPHLKTMSRKLPGQD